VGELRPGRHSTGQSTRAARSPEPQLSEAIATGLSFRIYCLLYNGSRTFFLLKPSGAVSCTILMMTRHDPPKKERWLCAFLNSFLLATPPLPSPPLLPISLLHRIRRCGRAAALPDHAPGWCFLVFVAVIPDRRVS
jgi:hypothetical protein